MSVLKKLEGVDLNKLSPDQLKKVAAAVAQSAKKSEEAVKIASAAKKANTAAKSALKSGKKDLIAVD